MTIAKTGTSASYAGNGATTAFAFPYRFLQDNDLQVYIVVTDGTATLQTLTTDYTVSNNGDETGGTVTMIVAPASGETLLIERQTDQTQSADYVNNDPFPAETHEDALDKLTLIAQEEGADGDRHITFPAGDAASPTLPISSTRKNKLLGFDGGGGLLLYDTTAPIAAAFSTRAALVASPPSLGDGSIVAAGGFLYEADSASTDISDLTGFKPFGPAYLNHWAANLTPGTTDMRAAIQEAWDWSASTGKAVTGLPQSYGISDSGSDIGGRSYGLLLKDGLRFHAMAGCTFKVLDSQDIDMINTDRTATLARVTLTGDLTLDGNEANQGGSPANGFNIWAYDITHFSFETIRSRDPASWGIRIERCDKVDYSHIDCDHSAESNSDGVHYVDTSNVTGQSANIKSEGDDAYIIEALSRDVSDYNLGSIIVDTENNIAAGRGFLILGDESVMTGAHTISNIMATVSAHNCVGGAVVLSGASYQNISITSVSDNCAYDLQINPGNATYAGAAKNCSFILEGSNSQTSSISTSTTNGTITHCNLNARVLEPNTAASAVTLLGEYWTGSIDVNYSSGDKGLSAGVNWQCDNSEMHITAMNAKWGLLVQGGAINNTFYLGTLEGNTTNDLNVGGGATGNRFIGGRIAASVSLSAGDEWFDGVKGANYRQKIALDFSTNADGTVTVPHGLVGTPKMIQLTPQTQVAQHMHVDTATVPDGTNITIYGQSTGGAAYTTGIYNCYIEASL